MILYLRGDFKMIAKLNGDFETVDYAENRNILLYDNVEYEEYPKHWHNAFELIMPLQNSYTVICSGREYVLSERDIMLIPPGALHSLKAQHGRRLIFLCDNNALLNNPVLSALYPVISNPLHINSKYDDNFLSMLNQIVTDIYTLYSRFSDMTEFYIYSKFITMLAHIREYQLNAIKCGEESPRKDDFGMILKYIDKNYMNDITLEALADIAGYSKYHFSRMFKKYTGTSFINFLNERRINSAILMLIESDMSITDIAMRSGFASLTTFNRIFKSVKDCTPSEFKKMYKY